jgi:hypothetical protein
MADRELEMRLLSTHRAEIDALRRELVAVREENIRLQAEIDFRRNETDRLRRELDAVRDKGRRAR